MEKIVVKTDKAPAAIGPYSAGICAGNLVFTAGQIPVDPAPGTMAEPIDGIAVAYYATQGSHSRKSLNRVVRHAIKHDGYVGGWLDTSDSLYYFDSTRIFHEDSLDAAIKFGLKNRQKAIFSIVEKREIRLN